MANDFEIYGTEVKSFLADPIGVRVEVTNGKEAPKHVEDAYCVVLDGQEEKIPGGRALMLEEGSELRLRVAYRREVDNLGFGVKVYDRIEEPFVDELYFPHPPHNRPPRDDRWTFGEVDRNDAGLALELKSGRVIDRQFGTGSAELAWKLTVSIWPILEWEDRDTKYSVPGGDSATRDTTPRAAYDDSGGVVSGRPRGRIAGGRHMRIIRSAIDGSTKKERAFDIEMHLFVATAQELRKPVLKKPPT